jgi:cell wall-associated NlpC family hydrolase
VATPLATAFVRIRPDLSTFQAETTAGVAKSGEKSAATFSSSYAGQLRKGMPAWALAGTQAGQSFGSKFGGAVGQATRQLAKVGLAAYAAGMYLAVKQGMALEDSQARLNTAITNAGGKTATYAKALDLVRSHMEDWGFSNAEVNTSLGTLTTATGSITKAMGAEATAANLARFKHIDLAGASDILAKAFAGNMRSMKGLNLTIATGATSAVAMKKAQTDLSDQIASAGGVAKFAAAHHLSLAAAQKLIGQAAKGSIPAMNQLGLVVLPASASAADRYSQITKALNERIGGQAAAAAGTAAGRFGILKTQFLDLAAKIGVMVLPKLVGVLTWLEKTHLLIPILATVMGVLTVAIIAQAAAWALTPFGEVALAIMGLIAAIILIKTHWQQITSWWSSHPLATKVIMILLGPIGLLIGAIMAIATHWTAVKNAVTSAIAFILGKISTFLGGMIDVVKFAAKMPGPLGAPFRAMVGPLQTAKAHVDALQTSIAAVKSKNVVVSAKATGDGGVTAHSTGIFGTSTGNLFFYPAAQGGLLRGGIPGKDSILVAGMPGEVIIPTSLVKAGAVDHLRGKLPGFASGGQIGNTSTWMAGKEAAAETKALIASMKAAIAGAAAGGSAGKLIQYALQFVGKVPYVWGGTTPAGWDCSGFTSYVYHHFGIPAPRTSQAQQLWARPSGDHPGALVFFYGTGGTASHVGLSMGNGKMINAYGTGYGTIISPSHMSGFSGFGIPPSGRFGRGGVISEPVVGVGQSGRAYSFAENGPETVIPNGGGSLGRVEALLAQLVREVRKAPARTGAATAAGIGGITRSAAAAGYYSTRP